jgi:hypothetical protein
LTTRLQLLVSRGAGLVAIAEHFGEKYECVSVGTDCFTLWLDGERIAWVRMGRGANDPDMVVLDQNGRVWDGFDVRVVQKVNGQWKSMGHPGGTL